MTKVFDEFNEPCICKHRADEHIAGDGHCFKCDCGKFEPLPFISDAQARRYLAQQREKTHK